MRWFLILLLILPSLATAGIKDRLILLRNGPSDKSLTVAGNLYFPSDFDPVRRSNAKFELNITGAITLRHLSEKTKLVGYTRLGLLKDQAGTPFDNKATFAVGLELRHQISPAIALAYGGKYKLEQEFPTGRRQGAFVLTADANLWKTWHPDWLKQRLPEGSRLILSGWANLRSPPSLYPSEAANLMAQAYLRFAVGLPIGKTQLEATPFVSFLVKADTKRRIDNNILEPAIGLDVKIPVLKDGQISVGLRAAHRRNMVSKTRSTRVLGLVSWYKKF